MSGVTPACTRPRYPSATVGLAIVRCGADCAAFEPSAPAAGGRYNTTWVPSSTSPDPFVELSSPTSRLRANGCVCTCAITRGSNAIFVTWLTPYCDAVSGESSEPRYPCSSCRYPTGGSVAGFVTVGRAGLAAGVCATVQLRYPVPQSAAPHTRCHLRPGEKKPRITAMLSLALRFRRRSLRALLRRRRLRRRLVIRRRLRRRLRSSLCLAVVRLRGRRGLAVARRSSVGSMLRCGRLMIRRNLRRRLHCPARRGSAG